MIKVFKVLEQEKGKRLVTEAQLNSILVPNLRYKMENRLA